MEHPFISIIIPVYNKQQYINRCLYSLLGQSYIDFEIIIINDGSTDGSKEVCLSFVDERIRFFDIENGGVSRARNYGLDVAQGEYVLFVDSDDWVDKNYLLRLVKDAEGKDFDIVLLGLTRVFANGKEKKVEMPDWSEDEFYRQYMYLQDVKSVGIIGFVCNKLLRRSFIEQHNLRFDTSIRMAEDVNFYIACFEQNPKIITSRECGYFYLQAAENSSFFQKNVDFFALMNIWKRCYLMLSGKGYGVADNKKRLYQKIFELFGAHFLEDTRLSLRKVREDFSKMSELSKSLPEFWNVVEPKTELQKRIKKESVYGIYYYLLCRRIYHILRYHRR